MYDDNTMNEDVMYVILEFCQDVTSQDDDVSDQLVPARRP